MVFASLFSHRVRLQTLSCLSDSLHGDNIAATAPGITLMVTRRLPQPQAPHPTSPSGKGEGVYVMGGTGRVVRECSLLGLHPFYQGGRPRGTCRFCFVYHLSEHGPMASSGYKTC